MIGIVCQCVRVIPIETDAYVVNVNKITLRRHIAEANRPVAAGEFKLMIQIRAGVV